MGAGLWLRLAYSGYATLVPQYSFVSADTIFLAGGCLTFVVAFFGCCGAWFQSRFMLITVCTFITKTLLLFHTFEIVLVWIWIKCKNIILLFCTFQYFSLVILVFLGEFMLGALAFVFREHLARSLKDELLFGIHKHYNVTREPGTLPAVWDHIHEEVHKSIFKINFLIKN